MYRIVKDVDISDVADIRDLRSVVSKEITGDGYADCFFAAAEWLRDNVDDGAGTLIGISHYSDPDGEGRYSIYLYVDAL